MAGLLDNNPITGMLHTPDLLGQQMNYGRAAFLPHVTGLLGGGMPPTAVSTRFPTAAGRAADPVKTPMMSGDLPAYNAGSTAAPNMSLISKYPGMSFIKGMKLPEATKAVTDRLAENMTYLFERSPKVMQKVSPLWYEGGERLVGAWSERYGVPKQATAAAAASLSPQKDWFENVTLTERTADILFNKGNVPWTSEMRDVGKVIYSSPANKVLLKRIEGKKLNDLTEANDRAAWIRLYDQTYNSPHYRSVAPDGGLGDFVRNADGSMARLRWQTLSGVSKAVRALESGGDMSVISPLLGTRHKVRNFYNNLLHPNERLGVTADTHQVAAGMMAPLSGASVPVMHNLANNPLAKDAPKGWQGAKGSAVTGFQGTYPLFEAATVKVSENIGLLPHKAQSATWEPVRTLFANKHPKVQAKVEQVWKDVDRGLLSPAQERETIYKDAGGIRLPSWVTGGLLYDPRFTSTY